MRQALPTLAGLVLLSWHVEAQAAVLTFNYSAVADAGGTVTGEFLYDTTRPDLEPLPNFGTYDSAWLRGSISGGPQNGQNFNTLSLADTANYAPGLGTDALKIGTDIVAIVLSDPTGTALSSEALPTGFVSWDLSQSIIAVQYRDPTGGLSSYIYRVNSLSLAVSEPMTLGLFGLGLASLALVRRHVLKPG